MAGHRVLLRRVTGGCFGSPERARHFVNRLHPARLVWFDPVA